jgi:UDP-glucose 4-epimerase
VLTISRRVGVKRFVYAASSSCYGIPSLYPTPETAPINPEYPYALTKYQGEELVLHWAKLYKLPAVALRFFNVYGPRARTSGTYGAMFGVFLAQKFAGKPFTVVGDGTQTRDFTYVTDVCDAIIEVAKTPSLSGAYNIGSGQTVSVNKIVELLGGERVHIPKRPGEPDSTFADITRICQDTPWRPKISIELGVQEMLKRINQWSSAPVWTDSDIAVATKDWFKYLS